MIYTDASAGLVGRACFTVITPAQQPPSAVADASTAAPNYAPTRSSISAREEATNCSMSK